MDSLEATLFRELAQLIFWTSREEAATWLGEVTCWPADTCILHVLYLEDALL